MNYKNTYLVIIFFIFIFGSTFAYIKPPILEFKLLVVFIFGGFLFFYDVLLKGGRNLIFRRYDVYFILFLIAFLFLSNIPNISSGVDTEVLIGQIVLVYGYVLYKVFDVIFNNMSKGNYEVKYLHKDIYDKLFFILGLSAIISITRYLDLPIITDFVNNAWPMYYHGEIVDLTGRGGRMVSTFSGIPGTGIVFGISTAINFHLYNKYRENKYLYYSSLFGLSTLLSGSITSMIILFALLGIEISKEFSFKLAMYSMIVVIVVSGFALQSEFLREVLIEDRIEQQIRTIESGRSVLPATLDSRVEHWLVYANLIKDHPLIGVGAVNLNQITGYSANPHNYYLYILSYSGIVGFIAFTVLISSVYRTASKYSMTIEKYVIIGLLISFITSLSFQYSGIIELFAIILAITSNKIYS